MDIGHGQLGIRICLTEMVASLTTFRLHVAYVVYLGSKEKMIGVYTRRIIALMKNAETIRNGAVNQYPSVAMGTHLLLVSPDPSVAVPFLQTSCPKPAGISYLNLALKANIRKGYGWLSHCENLRYRFELWLGSLTATTAGGPLSLYRINTWGWAL